MLYETVRTTQHPTALVLSGCDRSTQRRRRLLGVARTSAAFAPIHARYGFVMLRCTCARALLHPQMCLNMISICWLSGCPSPCNGGTPRDISPCRTTAASGRRRKESQRRHLPWCTNRSATTHTIRPHYPQNDAPFWLCFLHIRLSPCAAFVLHSLALIRRSLLRGT